MSIKKEIVRKIVVVYIMVLLLAFAIVGRILQLQFVEGDKWKKLQVGENSKQVAVPANRGDILACDGRMLASSIPNYSIHMDFRADGLTYKYFMQHVDSLALQLSRFFKDGSKQDYKIKLISGFESGNRYSTINRRRVSFTELQKIEKFPIFRLGSNKGGFIATQYDTRKLPFGELAARTIGKLNYEKTRGVVGLENAYNDVLEGEEGVSLTKTISGKRMKVNVVEPTDGHDVVTTIDIDLQDVAETALYAQLQKNAAHHGSAILMEVKTGDIKAIANLERTSDGSYSETYNFAIGEATEPGSTFKLASLIVALEDGVIDLTDTIDTEHGVHYYFGVPMRDSHEEGYGRIPVQEVFEKSSNIGVSKIIFNNYKDDPKRFVDRLLEMRLDQKLDIEIAGEAKPYIAYPGNNTWSGLSLPWMSIGYEVKLAPIQTLTFYNAIANDGEMVKPRFVKGISYHGDMIKRYDTEVLSASICSRQTLKKVKRMLEGVVENGTASNLQNLHYKIAGKTGTAQIAQGTKGYIGESGKQYYASFCGYFPADDPKYTCIVTVNSPTKSVFYGNVLAGNVFREIADKVYVQNVDMQKHEEEKDPDPEFKVPVTLDGNKKDLMTLFSGLEVNIKDESSNGDWAHTYNRGDHIEVKSLSIIDGLVPNVLGMGAKDALFLLENAGLSVRMSGVGRVVEQSILPGARITGASTIYIRLR
ncbi:penicillin-binding transpeptidase domain-containing protein [Saccharicrinis sp. FJH54]|uniref:penicillin-binding protein n=1 Tax=Saccharicrinis sp. FJH54 TaxID=3344665 RepID=UPI0035D49CE8